MQVSKWLAIYVDEHGGPRAAIITPKEVGDFPFGVDGNALGLERYDGELFALVELPADPDFRPMIVDASVDDEIPAQFIDL